jgi:hypothetical protein
MPERLNENYQFPNPPEQWRPHSHIADNDKYVDAAQVLYFCADA